jgi:hypothetical protein
VGTERGNIYGFYQKSFIISQFCAIGIVDINNCFTVEKTNAQKVINMSKFIWHQVEDRPKKKKKGLDS